MFKSHDNSQRPSASCSFRNAWRHVGLTILQVAGARRPPWAAFHPYILHIIECCCMDFHSRILTHAFYGFVVSSSLVKGTPCSSIFSIMNLSPPFIKAKIFKKWKRSKWNDVSIAVSQRKNCPSYSVSSHKDAETKTSQGQGLHLSRTTTTWGHVVLSCGYLKSFTKEWFRYR